MKKFIVLSICFFAAIFTSSLQAAPITTVDVHLLKAFAAAYPTAQQISWSQEDGNPVVHFLDHNVRAVIEYDADARVLNSTRYYSDPALLPSNLRTDWKRQYPDQTLFGVTEVTSGDHIAWFLRGQSSTQWITVKATTDGLQLVEKLKKQP